MSCDPARLNSDLSPATRGDHDITVRAVDAEGEVQSSATVPPSTPLKSALKQPSPTGLSTPGPSATLPSVEPVYGLTEGIANKRMRELALAGLERAPEMAEWIEPSLLAQMHWPKWYQIPAACQCNAAKRQHPLLLL